MYNPRGASFAIVNTEKGNQLFKYIQSELVSKECTIDECIQDNMKRPTLKSRHHDKIMKDYQIRNVGEFFMKWQFILLIERVRKKIF